MLKEHSKTVRIVSSRVDSSAGIEVNGISSCHRKLSLVASSRCATPSSATSSSCAPARCPPRPDTLAPVGAFIDVGCQNEPIRAVSRPSVRRRCPLCFASSTAGQGLRSTLKPATWMSKQAVIFTASAFL